MCLFYFITFLNFLNYSFIHVILYIILLIYCIVLYYFIVKEFIIYFFKQYYNWYSLYNYKLWLVRLVTFVQNINKANFSYK